MKTPSLVAVQINGKWTVPYIGDDAGPAKEGYSAAVNGGQAQAAFLFIRPDFLRRWKAGGKTTSQPQAGAESTPPVEAKFSKATKAKN
jgi:hypothetical protein